MTTSSLPGITGGLQHTARVSRIVADWRELVTHFSIDAPVASSVEERLWQIEDPVTPDLPSREEQALSIFEEVLGCVPTLGAYAEGRAEQCIELNELGTAASLLRNAERIYSACAQRAAINHADTLRALGQRLFRAGNFAEAKVPLDAALKAYNHLSTGTRLLHTAETAFDLAITLTKLEGSDAGYVDSCFELAAALFEHELGESSQQRVSCLLTYAAYEAARGEGQFAARHLRKALFALQKREHRDQAAEAEVRRQLDELRGISH